MEIKVVRFYEGGYMKQPFAFGGEEGPKAFDANTTYPSCLQNYVIDTGNEVFLVDTGLPKEFRDLPPAQGQMITFGGRIADYMSALDHLGYQPDRITGILLTHKHPDHSGELRSFPNAKIYVSEAEADALKLSGENIVKVSFKDGPYHNFEQSEKITDNIRMLPAPGHTAGNSIVVVEMDGLFYMLHGDITYTDAALRANKLSVVFEDIAAARQSLDKVRAFIMAHPTVYLSTHTPEGLENLEKRIVMEL